MKKTFFCAAVLGVAAVSVYAAPEITVSSNPALPGVNLIVESAFSKGVLGTWSVNSGNRDLVVVDKSDGVNDKTSLKITGNPTRSPNAYHRLRMAVPFKAGEPYYIRYFAKRCNSNSKLRSGGSLAFMPAKGGKYKYAQVPEHVAGDCEWAEHEYNDVIPVDSNYATFYLCYYKQTGYTLYDNIEFRCGWTELNVAVKGGGLQQVIIRNSVTGVVLKESIKGAEYKKTLKVPAFGSYSVEVLDRTGETTAKLYPENVDANVASGDAVVPLTPIKRVVMKSEAKETFTFALPAIAGKKVYLEFTGRLQKKSGPGGYTNALKVKVNDKSLGLVNVVKPGKVVVLKVTPKKKVNLANKNGFILFFCNTFAPIPAHNNYYPLTFENGNPFDFKLDITKLVEEGLNTVDLQVNKFKNTAAYLDNLRVVIE